MCFFSEILYLTFFQNTSFLNVCICFELSKRIAMRYARTIVRPTFFPCNSEHAIDDVDGNAGVREERWTRGRRVKRRNVIRFDDYKTRGEFRRSLARAIGTNGTRSEESRRSRRSRGESPLLQVTHSPLTHYSLTRSRQRRVLRTRARKRRKRALPTSRNSLSVAFQFDPAPGDVVSCRSLDHKSILLARRFARARRSKSSNHRRRIRNSLEP